MRDELIDSDREELERILSMDPEVLTPDEGAFLRARQSFLTKEEKEYLRAFCRNQRNHPRRIRRKLNPTR